MNKPNRTGLVIGIFGGIGLGLLLGSEFAGTFTTLSGAVLVVVLLVSMGIQFLNPKSQRLERACEQEDITGCLIPFDTKQ